MSSGWIRTTPARNVPFSEEGTRSWFIDKYLDALGYNEFEDIQHGSAMVSGNFPDYVVMVNGQPAIAVEAKKMGHLGVGSQALIAAVAPGAGVVLSP